MSFYYWNTLNFEIAPVICLLQGRLDFLEMKLIPLTIHCSMGFKQNNSIYIWFSILQHSNLQVLFWLFQFFWDLLTMNQFSWRLIFVSSPSKVCGQLDFPKYAGKSLQPLWLNLTSRILSGPWRKYLQLWMIPTNGMIRRGMICIMDPISLTQEGR